jgi:hypothetical protein
MKMASSCDVAPLHELLYLFSSTVSTNLEADTGGTTARELPAPKPSFVYTRIFTCTHIPGTCHVAMSPNELSTHNYQPRKP